MGDLSPGQLISLPDGRRAIIRFVGTTHFAPGEWAGVELDNPTGKNDGAVQGERYFECEPGFGMFIRPSAVASILAQPRREEPKQNERGGGNGPATRTRRPSGRAESGIGPKRPSISNMKRQSATSSPSPAPRAGTTTTGRSLRVRTFYLVLPLLI